MQEAEVSITLEPKMPHISQYGQLLPPETKPTDTEYSQILDVLVSKINPHFKAWVKDDAFEFQCPTSTFAGGKDGPIIAYHQPNELNDNVEVQPLTSEQLECIKQDGTFFVKSNYFSIPYKWTISEWIYKGVESIKVQLKKDVAKAYSQLYEIPLRVTSDFVSLKKGMIRVLKYVPNLLNLLFGMRRGHYQQEDIEYQLQLERQTQIYKKIWDSIAKDFYQYIRIPLAPLEMDPTAAQAQLAKAQVEVGKKFEKLRTVNQIFDKEWIRVRDDIQERFAVDDPVANRQRIREEKYKLLKKLIYEQGFLEQTDDRVKVDFIETFNRAVIIQGALERSRQKTKLQVEAYEAEINQNYPILRYAKKWKADKIDNYRLEREKANHQEFLLIVKDKLNLPIFSLHYEYLQSIDTRKEAAQRNLPKVFVPNRQFRCPYKLFPPYKVERSPSTSSPTGFVYELIKEENKYVSTTHFGWKTALNFVRWITWSINIMYWLFRGVWGGRLGVKVLFGCKIFCPRYTVSRFTGEINRSNQISWSPIAVDLRHTWEGIVRSRQSFERAPDNGFFGKTCARFCNIVENYVFRLIIVCFFWLIIIKPIVIIVNVIFCTLIAATAVLWVPIIIIIYYLFGLLIYNFDLDERHPSRRYSQRFFPLICGALKFVYDLAYTTGAFLMLIIHPILALLMLLSSVIRFIGRTIYDKIMFCIISCCGRSPVRDTAIAWKISGPGLSRQYFQSIRQEDVYILMIAELEKLQLQQFEKDILERLNSLRAEASSTMQYLTKATKSPAYNDFKVIDESIYFYRQKLNMQLGKIRVKFPQYPGTNVRFTQAELAKYVARTNEIIRSFVAKNRQQYLFEKMELKLGDFDRLNQKLWLRIFRNEDIFEPFENLDQRFELADDRQDEFVKGVMLAIEGAVNLREGSHVPMLKFKKKQDTINIITHQIVIGPYLAYQHKNLPASRLNIDFSIFVNINIPDILAEKEAHNVTADRLNRQKTFNPLSVEEF